MKIGLIGYGKMGQIIEKLALEAGHTVPLIIDQHNLEDLHPDTLGLVEVAIEFTRPESAPQNIIKCLEAGVPVVCGTTGWLEHYDEVVAKVQSSGGSLFYASNYSIGVNIFFAVNRYLATLMAAQPDYSVWVDEIHHTRKLDAPSGTAITIGEAIIEEHPGLSSWSLDPVPDAGQLPIRAFREGEVPGTHVVTYASAIDTLSMRHEAHSREGFAKGAIQAAGWLPGKKGVFSMEDLLGLVSPRH